MGKEGFLRKAVRIINGGIRVKRVGSVYRNRVTPRICVVNAQALSLVRDAVVAETEKDRKEDRQAALRAIDPEVLYGVAPQDKRWPRVVDEQVTRRAVLIVQAGHDEGLIRARVDKKGKVVFPVSWEYTTPAKPNKKNKK